jgi:hypothetical protein
MGIPIYCESKTSKKNKSLIGKKERKEAPSQETQEASRSWRR